MALLTVGPIVQEDWSIMLVLKDTDLLGGKKRKKKEAAS